MDRHQRGVPSWAHLLLAGTLTGDGTGLEPVGNGIRGAGRREVVVAIVSGVQGIAGECRDRTGAEERRRNRISTGEILPAYAGCRVGAVIHRIQRNRVLQRLDVLLAPHITAPGTGVVDEDEAKRREDANNGYNDDELNEGEPRYHPDAPPFRPR